MENKDTIIHNIEIIKKRIIRACEKSNCTPEEVKLLLATKTVPAERIKIALNYGYTLIGENRVQEVKGKGDELKDTPHQQHFIGHLQTNKIKDLLKYPVTCIESLDRVGLAERLDKRLANKGKTIDVLLQINTSNEESKFGVHPGDAIEFARQVAQFQHLKIKGLMTIGLFSAELERVRACFRLLRDIQQKIQQEDISGVEMKELSMGMSGDLEVAIEEGATIVRVGTAIFGERIYPDSYYWNEEK